MTEKRRAESGEKWLREAVKDDERENEKYKGNKKCLTGTIRVSNVLRELYRGKRKSNFDGLSPVAPSPRDIRGRSTNFQGSELIKRNPYESFERLLLSVPPADEFFGARSPRRVTVLQSASAYHFNETIFFHLPLHSSRTKKNQKFS